MNAARVVVIGAGIGGLAAALALAARGLEVTVLERAATPGGKMRQVAAGGALIDSGPTVFTMRWVFEELFAEAGARLSDHITLRPVDLLARHAWADGSRLDLFADIERSADAIGRFAGAAEAQGYRAFSARAERIYRTLERPFIRAAEPSPLSLIRAAGVREMAATAPFSTLWKALGEHFRDPRLRQLFGRYATYCGSSPYFAPATLMLVAHVEREGVWLVEGGMYRIAAALAAVAEMKGARFRYKAEVASIETSGGRASGVVLANGERIAADAVLFNGDVAALTGGLLGPAAMHAAPKRDASARSLSAVTWSMLAETSGFPLVRHTVFFSSDYAAEFAAIRAGRLPDEPTVYICAQDRGGDADPAPAGAERMLILVNAPARGDSRNFDASEIAACEDRTFALLARCGLTVAQGQSVVTTPAAFHRLFPATGGALYGSATHGAMSSFHRPHAKSQIPGLYLAGGSVHPGPGIPMAAMSGRLAAGRVIQGLGSTRSSRTVAMPGGMSTG